MLLYVSKNLIVFRIPRLYCRTGNIWYLVLSQVEQRSCGILGRKKIKGIGSVTAPAVDFPFPLTSLLYKGASAIYSSGQKGVYVLSGTGASIGLVNTGVYVLNQDIKDNNITTVAFIEYNVKGMWK